MTHPYEHGMRPGVSTGACAAAAAKAAAGALLGERPESVEVTLPGGSTLVVPVFDVDVAGGIGRAAVVKDAGDDPDTTNGMTVVVEVARGDEGIRFAAGDGVGTVTMPGLQLEVGEPAINPAPRRMIAAAVCEVLGDGAAALVTVSIPGGAEVAAKTFNPRLGIVGGLSVLGTSGRVEPKSSEAWMRSLEPQVDVALAQGHRTVWLVTGGIAEQVATEQLGAETTAVVQCSNFVGALLDKCAASGVERVMLVGHAGKLVKVAAGLFDTHSRVGDARLETVAAIAAAEGAPGPLVARLLELPTVEAAVPELSEAGLERVWCAIAERAAKRCTERAGLPVDVALVGYEREVLGATQALRLPEPLDGLLVVAGVGPGVESLLTPETWRELRSADVVAGGQRLLDAFVTDGTPIIPLRGDMEASLSAVEVAVATGSRVVMLASGDPGFFGVLATVRRLLPDVPVRVVPGISSAQLAAARMGWGWESVAFASAHGREPGPALEVAASAPRSIVLTGGDTTPARFAALLAEVAPGAGLTVCERLGHPDERLTSGSPAEMAGGMFDPLSLVVVENLGAWEGS